MSTKVWQIYFVQIWKNKIPILFVFVDTETVVEDDEEEQERNINNTTQTQPITTTESIELGNGLRLDLSSIDDEVSNSKTNHHSVDSDLEAINRSISRVGEWQTNFTLVESKVNNIWYHCLGMMFYKN